MRTVCVLHMRLAVSKVRWNAMYSCHVLVMYRLSHYQAGLVGASRPKNCT